MRLLFAAALVAVPALAMAQGAVPPDAPRAGRTITRDQFIQRAAQRFDQIDTAHTGTITRAQLRDWRQSHRGQGQGRGQPTP